MLNQLGGRNTWTLSFSPRRSGLSRRAELFQASLLAEVKPPLQKLSKKRRSLCGLQNAGTKFA